MKFLREMKTNSNLLGVDLSKHEQFHIIGRSAKLLEYANQVLNLGLVKAESLLLVVCLQNSGRVLAIGKDVHHSEGSRRSLCEHILG